VTLPRHYEYQAEISAPAEQVFALVDDQRLLSSHMSQSSWKMGGGKMTIDLDANRGQAVGSKIRMAGSAFGIKLFVEEVVTERIVPREKIWETIDEPKLLVIGHYRMGFEITPDETRSRLRVFIDYALPAFGFSRWLGMLVGPFYARWCTRQIVSDAQRFFACTPLAGVT
jgi:uncharacterized membrane protein